MGSRAIVVAAVLAVLLSALVVATPDAVAQTTIAIGETAVAPGNDATNGRTLIAQKAALTQTATLQTISFYVTRAVGQLNLGVYDSSGPGGGPGMLIAEATTFTPRTGWNTRAVVTPVSLPPGNYWLAFLPSNRSLTFRRANGGSARYETRSFGPLPATFSVSPTARTVHWSLNATLNASSASAPTVNLAASPTSVVPGGSSTLTWSTTDATGCTASNVGAEGSTWAGSKPTSGSDVRGPLTATATFSLACTGPGGTATKSVTVAVTATPATPTLSLAAAPASITTGQATTLSWSSVNATGCTATGAWSGTQALTGQVSLSPTSTSTYTLTCAGAGGTTTQSATVTVSTPTPTLTLAASPGSVVPGSTSTLTWSSTNTTSCTASNVGAEGSNWNGARPVSGSEVRGPLTATATYSLACSGPGGSVTKSVSIVVTAAAPAPTVSLTATPSTVTPGQPSTLAWSSTEATSCSGSGDWSGSEPLSGQLTVSTSSTKTYTLTCTGPGGTASRSATITVTGGPTTFSLSWVDNAGGTSVFEVSRKTDTAGTYATIATTAAGATQYLDTTPVSGVLYCYRVRAANAGGSSPYSNEACATR